MGQIRLWARSAARPLPYSQAGMGIQPTAATLQTGRPAAAPADATRTGVLTRVRGAPLPAIAVALAVLAGIVLRVVLLRQSLFADELSTYWIVARHGLGEVLALLYSHGRIQHAEITPPLFFILSWVTAQIGHAPELLRAPSLVAGVLTIPLVYALGVRTAGRAAGMLAAALTALSPFMIYYSAEARSYGVMMLLATGSTLAMLRALDGDGRRWWILYGACSWGAFLTHYTCAFLLAAQFLWLVVSRPDARRPALLANAAALIALLPWTGGLINDFRSPTTQILSALSPFTWHDVRLSLEHWSVGYPYVTAGGLRRLPGVPALVLLAIALLTVVAGLAVRLRRGAADRRLPELASSRLALVILLALSVPVGEAVASALSTHIFGVRNLAASWPPLALACSGAAMLLPRRMRVAVAVLSVAAFVLGAAHMLSARFRRPDFHGVAAMIDRLASPGAVVLDGSGELSPGPLTGLDLTLRAPVRVIRFGAPQERDHPFTLFDRIDPIPVAIARGFAAARGGEVFLVRYIRPAVPAAPPPYRLIRRRVFPSLTTLVVEVFSPRGRSGVRR